MTEAVVAVLGVFAADTTYRAARLPRMGETLLGDRFALSAGGKGSNQAIAAGRLGADARLITRVGRDAFAEMGRSTWRDAGVRAFATEDPSRPTAAAMIFVDDATGDNAIIICPGAAGALSAADVDAAADAIRLSNVFLTQLEQPIEAARRGLEIARDAGVTTILNPAPAPEAPLDDALLRLCDWITPNQSEVERLTGRSVAGPDAAKAAAGALLDRGVGGVIVTLGDAGALIATADGSTIVPALRDGDVVETTGAGDAFNGGFAVAIARGAAPVDAARFGCAVAGVSVTRAGAAASMPTLDEAQALFARDASD